MNSKISRAVILMIYHKLELPLDIIKDNKKLFQETLSEGIIKT